MSTMSNLQQEEGLMCAGIFELCMYDNTTCNNECTSNILPSLFNWQLTEYSCIHYSVCSNSRSVGIWSSFHCYLFLLGASSSSVYMANTKYYLKHWLCAKEQGFFLTIRTIRRVFSEVVPTPSQTVYQQLKETYFVLSCLLLGYRTHITVFFPIDSVPYTAMWYMMSSSRT